MKIARIVLALVFLAACKGADTAPTTGQVFFKIDGVSCKGSDAIKLFVDGSAVGTETLTAGGVASTGYMVSAGGHLLGATEVNSPFFSWPSTHVTVTAGGTFTQLLTC